MITIFNRKEVATTFSMEKQAKIRTILSENGIPYTYRVVNRSSPSSFDRARIPSFGQNLSMNNQYIFYVHKNDFDAATFLVGLPGSSK